MPQRRLLGAVPGHGGLASAALDLARRLAAAAQRIEAPVPGAGASGSAGVEGGFPREMPGAGPFAVGDQLSVAGHDLAAALAPLPGAATVPGPDGRPAAAQEVLRAAVAEVEALARLCGR